MILRTTRRALLAAAPLAFAAPLRAQAPAQPPIVLVHGAWMGAGVWRATAQALAASGHEVLAPELPAHGADPTPANEATLLRYVESVTATIGDRRNVVRVGHSFGGIVISAVAETAPERLRRLVYLAAYLPQSGESAYALSQRDPASLVGRYWRQEDPSRYSPASIAREGIVETFCADCAPAEAAWLVANHRAEPVPPLATPVALSAARFGSVPRAYILTSQDRTISPSLQRAMAAAAGIAAPVELPTGHAPMLSAPDALAAAIARIAAAP
jgi:pimeloyl-ACP methyl ester carboxylesterase